MREAVAAARRVNGERDRLCSSCRPSAATKPTATTNAAAAATRA
jgi:hypothetical protein